MFSDSSAPAPGEQRGFKPHAPHFIPWLRNSLRPHRGGGDPGLNAPYKSGSEVRNNLTKLERAKGLGLFSIPGKERAKKGEIRCDRVGMARMLPAVLRGHHILPGSLGKQRKDSPPRWNHESPELHPDANVPISPGDRPQGLTNSPASAQDSHTFVRNHCGHLNLLQSQGDGTSTLIRKYGPLVAPPSAPVPDEANCRASVVEDKRGKVCDYGSSATYRQRDLHSSEWLSSDPRGPAERKHGLTSSFSSIKHKSRISKSHRDLTALWEPPVEGLNGPLNGVVISSEAPQTGPGHSATLRGSGKPRPSLEGIETLGQNRTCVRYSPTNDGVPQRKEAGCTRKVVRNQIKRVVDNLEQVLRALRDVHQEMTEVVQKIDHLTSSVELSEEERWTATGGDNTALVTDNSSGSDTSSSEATVGSAHRRRVKPEHRPGTTDSSGTLRRDRVCHRRSPPNVLLYPLPSERTQNTHHTNNLGFPSTLGLPLLYRNNLTSLNPSRPQNPTSHDLTLSPQRSLPVRPPTPGLSPLTVNLHHASSPTSRPHSPGPSSSVKVSPPSPVSPKPQPPPPTFSSAVVTESKIGSYPTPQSDHPSAGQFSPSSIQPPSASHPPTDTATQTVSSNDRAGQASSAGPVHRPSQVSAVPAAAAKPPTQQGRRGRKPPPYPHNNPPEHTKEAREPRKAPPYPEKRRPLSTTV